MRFFYFPLFCLVVPGERRRVTVAMIPVLIPLLICEPWTAGCAHTPGKTRSHHILALDPGRKPADVLSSPLTKTYMAAAI